MHVRLWGCGVVGSVALYLMRLDSRSAASTENTSDTGRKQAKKRQACNARLNDARDYWREEWSCAFQGGSGVWAWAWRVRTDLQHAFRSACGHDRTLVQVRRQNKRKHLLTFTNYESGLSMWNLGLYACGLRACFHPKGRKSTTVIIDVW